jgi:integrase
VNAQKQNNTLLASLPSSSINSITTNNNNHKITTTTTAPTSISMPLSRGYVNFRHFIICSYKTTLDNIIIKINKGSEDPYDILNGYVTYLQTAYNISASTLKERVVTAKNFLEYYDVDISPRKFKLKVKMPKAIRKSKEALSKEDIIEILNACSDIRLKTYVMLLAATGMRALSIRNKDLDFHSSPAKVFVNIQKLKLIGQYF